MYVLCCKRINYGLIICSAKPNVNAEDLTVEYRGSVAKLTWEYEVTHPEITLVVIEQCIFCGACTKYNVTENTKKTLEVPASTSEIFYLVIYQDGLEAYRSERFRVVTVPTAGMQSTIIIFKITDIPH